jgi:hypothetical protein
MSVHLSVGSTYMQMGSKQTGLQAELSLIGSRPITACTACMCAIICMLHSVLHIKTLVGPFTPSVAHSALSVSSQPARHTFVHKLELVAVVVRAAVTSLSFQCCSELAQRRACSLECRRSLLNITTISDNTLIVFLCVSPSSVRYSSCACSNFSSDVELLHWSSSWPRRTLGPLCTTHRPHLLHAPLPVMLSLSPRWSAWLV